MEEYDVVTLEEYEDYGRPGIGGYLLNKRYNVSNHKTKINSLNPYLIMTSKVIKDGYPHSTIEIRLVWVTE